MAEQSTELAKPAADLMSFGGGAGRLATSLDMQSQSGRHRMLKCLQDCDARLTDEVNIPLNITDYLVHDVELTNKDTGEVTGATRMVLIDDKQCTHECVSLGLLRSFQRLASLFGIPPWEPAKRLTVKSKRKAERNLYWLECE